MLSSGTVLTTVLISTAVRLRREARPITRQSTTTYQTIGHTEGGPVRRRYPQINGLDQIYLEDSYVLTIAESPDAVVFEMEFVLREAHPRYRGPRDGEQYCYRRGTLTFPKVRSVGWKRRTVHEGKPRDDLGNIDTLEDLGSGQFHVVGDWGEVLINGDDPCVLLE